LPRTNEPACDGEYFSPLASTHASPLPLLTILYGTLFRSFCTWWSSNRRPMSRFVAKSVPSGLVTACRFAGVPTSRWPSSVKPMMDGVVRWPSAFSMTLGLPPSITATHELVVPRSMPMTSPTGAELMARSGALVRRARPADAAARRSIADV